MFGPDLGLGLLPEPLELTNALSLQLAPKGRFHPRKAIQEAAVGARQTLLGVDAAPAGHVHQGEQQIAQFLLGVGRIAAGLRFRHRLLELIELLMHLLPHAGQVVPLEACRGSFFRDRHRTGQGALAPHLAR